MILKIFSPKNGEKRIITMFLRKTPIFSQKNWKNIVMITLTPAP
jgi:hypothetical protein